VPVITRQQRRQLERDNAKWGMSLERVPPAMWSHMNADPTRIEVWRSNLYVVQIFAERDDVQRLSINRASVTADGSRWEEDIPWHELQRIKRECGRGDRDAVEIFPRDADVVNVANMRHLWVLPALLPYAWRHA
jgi:hypothetical protein